MKLDFSNQVVCITGGNAGIGKAIAKLFAESGAQLALLGTNLATGTETVTEIKNVHPHAQVCFYLCDVSSTKAVDAVVERVLIDFGKVDVLVNNAGITADQLLMKMSEEEWDRVLNINLKSCYNLCHALIRPMLKAKQGRIINISSVVGLVGNGGQTNYAASKAGMIGFTKALAKEVAKRGICVNCIAPGFIETKMTAVLSGIQKEETLREIPMGCMGAPEDIAAAVLFFASSLARYITGQVLAVDGGMVMH